MIRGNEHDARYPQADVKYCEDAAFGAIAAGLTRDRVKGFLQGTRFIVTICPQDRTAPELQRLRFSAGWRLERYGVGPRVERPVTDRHGPPKQGQDGEPPPSLHRAMLSGVSTGLGR